MARTKSVLFVVTIALAGCASRPLAWSVPDDAGPMCSTHVIEEVPVSSVGTLDGTDTYVPARALRLVVSAALRSCDGFLATHVEVSPGSSAVVVSASAVLGTVGCGAPQVVSQVATVSVDFGTDADLVVKYGTQSLTLKAIPAAPDCTPRADGDPCTADCECPAILGAIFGTACLVGTDGTPRCGVPCQVDNDCGAGKHCDGTRHACVTGGACRSACAFGEHLVDCSCLVDAPPQPAPSCACDADCPVGTLCSGTACIVPCSGAGECGQDAPASVGLPFLCSGGACEQPNP